MMQKIPPPSNHNQEDAIGFDTLNSEFKRAKISLTASSKSKKSPFAILGALCIAALTLTFVRFWPHDSVDTPANRIMAVNTYAAIQDSHPESLPNVVAHTTPPKPKTTAIPNPAANPCLTDQPSKMAWEPNDNLEHIVIQAGKSEQVQWLSTPTAEATFRQEDCQVEVAFEGVMKGEQQNLNIAVYSNQSEICKPLLEEPLLWEKTGANLRYNFKPTLNLSPGLYYFVIENMADRAVAAGKFIVG